MKYNVLVIGISGVSNGGKTSSALHLKQHFGNKFPVHVIHQDDYYKEENEVVVDPINNILQWDVVEAFHMDKMIKDICAKIKEFESKLDYSIIIVEGILLYNVHELNNLFHLRFLFTLPYSEAKLRRDARVYIPPDVPLLFDKHVWPMYEKYRDSVFSSNFPFVEILGQNPQSDIFCFMEKTINDLQSLAN